MSEEKVEQWENTRAKEREKETDWDRWGRIGNECIMMSSFESPPPE
jgi:hypothetical protein